MLAGTADSISELLAAHRINLLEAGGSLDDVNEMLATWQRLWKDFGTYIGIRDGLVGQLPQRPIPKNPDTAALIEHLRDVGLLVAVSGGRFKASCEEASRCLRGSWLEELGAHVAVQAGADEVRFSQQITWQSHYDDRVYQNEIDVLARFGEQMVFVSCKALSQKAIEQSNGAERIFDAMKEVAYWRQHFGAGRGHAILLTTADFIDEARHRPRNARLLEHADVLGVRLVSADVGDFDGLVTAFRTAISAR